MANNIISEHESFFTSFEPRLKNRFIVYVDGLPSYIVRKISNPTLKQDSKEIPHINVSSYVKGKSTWGPMSMTLYDPISPSGAQAMMEWVRLHHESVTGRDGYMAFYKKDIVVNGLGPVGDKISEWVLKGCLITEVNFGENDWSSDDLLDVTINFQPDFCLLNY